MSGNSEHQTKHQALCKAEVEKINWLDNIFIFLLIITSWQGFFYGLLAGLLRLAGWLVAFYAAVRYHRPLAQWLADQWGWADYLARLLGSFIKLPAPFNSQEILSLPVGMLQKLSSQFVLPAPWPEIIDLLGRWGQHCTVGQAFNLLLAHALLNICSLVAVILAVRIIAGWLMSVVSFIVKFSPLGPVDKLAGLLLGFCTGIVIITLIISVLVPLQVPLALLGTQGLTAELARGISESLIIAKWQPLVQNLHILPSLGPRFDKSLFKYLPAGPGTQI
ncbi:CvpA family protein [Desulforamulus hydrothermalis]|uniref:Colicin V production protein n=1 Tax=Desulforamulus hydrothermalis Lam5 = DSM 18033 TaxID=1121428 RepID=K8EI93_9FIRM|nr:CvpA family protein [Desulforamulus hydrothermalis]CCO08336.1 Colicin V production protein [Desulforamulus hydrothermalis Lam5 = DSM 18033]SHH44936.1 Colicin V production protein [Desulforamulus hydrothermalis Lam5 = DSM 18033]